MTSSAPITERFLSGVRESCESLVTERSFFYWSNF